MNKPLAIATALALAATLAATPALAADVQCTALPTTLELGSTDAATAGAVTKLQTFLGVTKYLAQAPSGAYGTSTAEAVSAFQADYGITRTGAAGPITRLRIQTITCPLGVVATATSTPVAAEPPYVYNPALPPPDLRPAHSGLNPVKINYKKGRKTSDGFETFALDFEDREEALKISWWNVRVYCEGAAARFGENSQFGCGDETGRLNSSKARLGAIYGFRVDAAADGRARGRVTVRAWAYTAEGKLVGDNRVSFWAR